MAEPEPAPQARCGAWTTTSHECPNHLLGHLFCGAAAFHDKKHQRLPPERKEPKPTTRLFCVGEKIKRPRRSRHDGSAKKTPHTIASSVAQVTCPSPLVQVTLVPPTKLRDHVPVLGSCAAGASGAPKGRANSSAHPLQSTNAPGSSARRNTASCDSVHLLGKLSFSDLGSEKQLEQPM